MYVCLRCPDEAFSLPVFLVSIFGRASGAVSSRLVQSDLNAGTQMWCYRLTEAETISVTKLGGSCAFYPKKKSVV